MYAENYCTSWLRFFFFVSSNISGQEECRTSRNALGDYSDPYGVTPCPKFGSVEKHGGKIWVRGRKRLQVGTQTFASGDANVCNRSRKRLRCRAYPTRLI